MVSLYMIEAVSSLQECDDMLKCLLYFLVLPGNILSFLNIFHESDNNLMNEIIFMVVYYTLVYCQFIAATLSGRFA